MINNKVSIDEMLAALEANIEYLRINGNSRITIRNGKLLHAVEDKYIYEFQLEFLQNIEPSAEIEVQISNLSANGTVISVSDRSIQIEIDNNLGDKVTEARLIISSYYLLELLKKRLEKIQSGEINVTNLADEVFSDSDIIKKNSIDYSPPPSKDKPLNKYQLEALSLAIGSPISFIWGPPGTGKTQTIASIIEGFVAQEKSVLLLSHTNKATDEALKKTIDHLGEDNTDYQEGKIIRIGAITLNELKNKNVTPEQIAERNGLGIKKEIHKIVKQLNRMETEVSNAKASLKKFKKLEDLTIELDNIDNYINTQENKYNEYYDEIVRSKSSLESLRMDLKIYKAKGRFGRIISLINPDQLNLSITDLLKLINRREIQLNEIQNNLTSSKLNRRQLLPSIKKCKKELPRDSEDYFINIIDENKIQVQELSEEKGELEKELLEIQENLIINAKIVATTLTKSYSSKTVLSRNYDCVIIDEVSMAPLPAVYCASGLAQKNVVLVGDFLQLPPVTQHKTIRTKNMTLEQAEEEKRLINDWLLRDIFSLSGVEGAIRTKKHPNKLRQLRIQYRMDKTIAELVNTISYQQMGKDYTLETDEDVTSKGWSKLKDLPPVKGFHIGFYDTSARSPIASNLDNGSYYNVYNALVCIEIAKEAVKSGYDSIGIISGYRAQANLMQKMVLDTFRNNEDVIADTVHRFQGGAKELIIFDITTAKTSTMYDDGKIEGNDMKLLNVAISRAQKKCIIVGDKNQITKNHSLSSSVRKMIEHISDKRYPIIDSEKALVGYHISSKSDEWLSKLADSSDFKAEIHNSKLFDETDFYSQFIKDMLNASREIIIDSPYITSRRVNDLFKYFEHIRSKGVNIFILTRVPNEQSNKTMVYYSETEIDRLSSIGVRILPFAGKIHRKIAIIDRKILWEGSLNILSQNDSKEIMRRFDGENSSKQMLSFLKLDKNLGEIGNYTLKHCEFCDSPVAWYWTDKSIFGGLWTYCLLNRHKEGTPPKSQEELKNKRLTLKKARSAKKEKSSDGIPICPVHELVMIKRKGPWGEFYGCPRYPACKITDKI